jgi:hypothetical protein
MKESLQPRPSGIALSAHLRRKEFHRRIAASAVPAQMPASALPQKAWPQWFQIVDMPGGYKPAMAQIKEAVCEHFGVKLNDMLSHRRSGSIVIPRQIAMYLCKELTTSTLEMIGRAFGDRNHTTVLSAIRKMQRLIPEMPEMAQDISEIRRRIEADNG